MKKSLLAAAAVLSLAGGGWYAATLSATGPAPMQAAAQDAEAPVTVQEMTLGDPQADVQVIEYASFTCPHCATFHEGPFQQIKENYIDTGKIGFTYREVYFDRFSLWAGMIARCAGDTDRYFAISGLIYDQQREWTQGDPATIAENLRRIGKTAGLDDERLDACLNDAAKAQALVARYEETTKADDINATPSFVINGEKYSNMSYEDFAAILDEKLGG
ncbi:putative thiol-disulfide oxidoreductase D [Oceaniovalibus guishaninsula JLT2003]|uniref:Putative thiol-disulfide oxidoreductase D n=1 Tax=Oceaniovalibus guishaninsula JLT2003 TaxID=1231392 RepID=K2I7B8_9RHOB|nr:DsbA family protein [Oceaniovalibus guishaninsula]EKE44915.1 putative thiol-disulfide oxidoreductase D [Oceaniovalibus guishaninsula JLT2003]